MGFIEDYKANTEERAKLGVPPLPLTAKQTAEVEKFANRLSHMGVPLEFQDESLTSVMAEDRLKNQGQIYSKGQIDSMAAAIILQDYLGVKYGY